MANLVTKVFGPERLDLAVEQIVVQYHNNTWRIDATIQPFNERNSERYISDGHGLKLLLAECTKEVPSWISPSNCAVYPWKVRMVHFVSIPEVQCVLLNCNRYLIKNMKNSSASLNGYYEFDSVKRAYCHVDHPHVQYDNENKRIYFTLGDRQYRIAYQSVKEQRDKWTVIGPNDGKSEYKDISIDFEEERIELLNVPGIWQQFINGVYEKCSDSEYSAGRRSSINIKYDEVKGQWKINLPLLINSNGKDEKSNNRTDQDCMTHVLGTLNARKGTPIHSQSLQRLWKISVDDVFEEMHIDINSYGS
jgi:hypothetical protein